MAKDMERARRIRSLEHKRDTHINQIATAQANLAKVRAELKIVRGRK